MHYTALVLVGAWLLIYRLPLQTQKFGALAEKLTTACCGLSLALLAPLAPWPPPGFRALSLGLLGVMFAFCHPAFTAMIVTLPLGIAFGALLWQFGLCSVVPGYHALVLSLATAVFFLVFICTPGIAGVHCLRNILVPSLAALLLTTALAGLVPSLGALEPRALLLESPCAANHSDVKTPLISLTSWTIVAALAIGMQLFFYFRALRIEEGREEAARAPGGDLVASLLPTAQGGGANEWGIDRPGQDFNNRFQMIVRAIYAEEGTDQSHLSEHEAKLVQICRQDEFERDRLVWGGGLI